MSETQIPAPRPPVTIPLVPQPRTSGRGEIVPRTDLEARAYVTASLDADRAARRCWYAPLDRGELSALMTALTGAAGEYLDRSWGVLAALAAARECFTLIADLGDAWEAAP